MIGVRSVFLVWFGCKLQAMEHEAWKLGISLACQMFSARWPPKIPTHLSRLLDAQGIDAQFGCRWSEFEVQFGEIGIVTSGMYLEFHFLGGQVQPRGKMNLSGFQTNVSHRSHCCLGNLLFRHFPVGWFFYKEGCGVGRTVSFLTRSQLTNPLLNMKFAFSLLPIAAVLGLVQAGPVAAEAESLVRALILLSEINRAHYWHVVDQACSRSGQKACLWRRYLHMHCILGNNSRNPIIFQANPIWRITVMVDGLLGGPRPCSIKACLDIQRKRW